MSILLEELKQIDKEECDNCKNKNRCYDMSCTGTSKKTLSEKLWDRGYRKVTTCSNCIFLEERVIAEAFAPEVKKMYVCKSPNSHMKGIARFDTDYFCSEGKPKEILR